MRSKLPPGVVLVHGRYYRRQYIGMVDGKRRYKMHALTRESEGLPAMYRALSDLDVRSVRGSTSVPIRITEWVQQAIPGLSADEQREYIREAGVIGRAFEQFTTPQVQAKHIHAFLSLWTSKGNLNMAKKYRGRLRLFFAWCIVQGDRQDNPVDPVQTKAPQARTRYMTDDEFIAIRAKLLGDDGKPAASGATMQCYVDLLYLTGQRGKDIRSLRWTQVTNDVIQFTPSKTKKTTGVQVDIPITPAIAGVLSRAKELMRDKSRLSPYVIHTLNGEAYAAHGVNTAWRRARERAGIRDTTLRDLRAKHATDAEKQGHSVEEISQGLAHADQSMTRTYLKQRSVKRGKINLELPK